MVNLANLNFEYLFFNSHTTREPCISKSFTQNLSYSNKNIQTLTAVLNNIL